MELLSLVLVILLGVIIVKYVIFEIKNPGI
jgi:hypothetical protein